ncbi:MAG TPA: hypothetical protein VEJ44_05850 [Acidimicrobiales bacterium]|nr:hypothetical protein [Acidimicrobiales bacterium]
MIIQTFSVIFEREARPCRRAQGAVDRPEGAEGGPGGSTLLLRPSLFARRR